jgi:integrase
MPCHHALADALCAYIDAACIAEDRHGYLFRTARGHKADALSDRPMNQSDAWLMIRRRAKAAGIDAPIGCHTFHATGITAYLANGGALERAGNGRAREPAYNQALRSHQGAAHSRRGGEDSALKYPACAPTARPEPYRLCSCGYSVSVDNLYAMRREMR